jgi:hypothetical protein
VVSARRSVTLCEGTPGANKKRSGPTRLWAFGYGTLAKLFGVKEVEARRMVAKKQLKPEDLEAVCKEWASRSEVGRLPVWEPEDVWDQSDLERWEKRWPRVEMWRCGAPECNTVLLERGLLCEEHGGEGGLRFDSEDFVCLGGTRLHHLIAGKGVEVRHKDGNKWNNHPSNLEVVKS